MGEGAGGADRRLGDSDRRDRAADDLLGEYELTEPEGAVVERGRSTEDVRLRLAHTEGSMSDSLFRGARAAAESGGSERTCSRTESASILLRLQVRGRSARPGDLDRWRGRDLMRLDRRVGRPFRLAPREAPRGQDARRRPDVPRPLALDDQDAVGANMMTRNSYFLNMGYVMERAPVKDARCSRRTWAATRSPRSSTSRVATEDGHRRDDAHRGRDPVRERHRPVRASA